MNNRQQFFVHIDLGDGQPVVAGFHQIDITKNMGTFIYGKTYCDNPNAFALDPINLPLVYNKPFHFPITRFNPSGIPGVLLDSGPDEWGKRILYRFSETPPVSAADYLVMGSGYGVGALFFSDKPDTALNKNVRTEKAIEQLYQSAIDFDNNAIDSIDIHNYLMPSSGIGGARPKAHLLHKGKLHIAKFNRRDDTFDNTLAEFCMMNIAGNAGINCAPVSLQQTNQGNAILVERFDIADTITDIETYSLPPQKSPDKNQPQTHSPENMASCRKHLVSANALLNLLELSELNAISYDRIAAIGKQISNGGSISKALFTRMLFNIAIGNTDDHTRNHAFLKQTTTSGYQLSPAYDLVPLPFRIGSHAINIGPFGQMPTLDNIRLSGRLMGLDAETQAVSAQTICRTLDNLAEQLSNFGMSNSDITHLAPCFAHSKLIAQISETALDLGIKGTFDGV